MIIDTDELKSRISTRLNVQVETLRASDIRPSLKESLITQNWEIEQEFRAKVHLIEDLVAKINEKFPPE